MIIESLNDIPKTKEVAVIINVGTKYVTALALLSWLKFTKIPVILIDCESKDGSFDFFSELQIEHEFYLTKLPLRKHGLTLDHVFRHINSELIYLVDSDTELLNDKILELIKDFIEKPDVFGAGFIHEASWLNDGNLIRGLKFGYFMERMWIPFTCLKTDLIRQALDHGFSFMNQNILNDFYFSQFISKLLIGRQLIPLFKSSRLAWLNLFKKSVNGQKPSYIVYDTGSKVYQYLKFDKGYNFVGVPAKYHEDYVLHFHGITRQVLDPNDKNTYQLNDYQSILEKLEHNYNIRVQL
jgi:hypothetical protein